VTGNFEGSDRWEDDVDSEGNPQLRNHPIDLHRELRTELKDLAGTEMKVDARVPGMATKDLP
jgi:hypothetical protein